MPRCTCFVCPLSVNGRRCGDASGSCIFRRESGSGAADIATVWPTDPRRRRTSLSVFGTDSVHLFLQALIHRGVRACLPAWSMIRSAFNRGPIPQVRAGDECISGAAERTESAPRRIFMGVRLVGKGVRSWIGPCCDAGVMFARGSDRPRGFPDRRIPRLPRCPCETEVIVSHRVHEDGG